MKLTLTVLATVVIKFSLGFSQNRIFNGYQAQTTNFPYVAYIRIFRNRKATMCTGSLISHYYVLTAAHCLKDNPKKITVILGMDAISDNNRGLKISCSNCWLLHPDYIYPQYPLSKGETNTHEIPDIALIELPVRVNFTNRIKPVSLPSYQEIQEDLVGQTGTVLGWGETNPPLLPRVLMVTTAKIMDQETCSIIFTVSREPYDKKNQFCTSHLVTGTCLGDSGGPFVIREKQFGVVSGGTNLDPVTGESRKVCAPNYGNSYTNVASFLKWIEENSDIKIGW